MQLLLAWKRAAPSKLLMFRNQSGPQLFEGQRLSVGDACSERVLFKGKSVE
jgi:hypothetical protein